MAISSFSASSALTMRNTWQLKIRPALSLPLLARNSMRSLSWVWGNSGKSALLAPLPVLTPKIYSLLRHPYPIFWADVRQVLFPCKEAVNRDRTLPTSGCVVLAHLAQIGRAHV